MNRRTLAATVPELAAFHNALADVMIKQKQATHVYSKCDRKQTSQRNFQSGAGLSLPSSPEPDVPIYPPWEHQTTNDEQTNHDTSVDDEKGKDLVVHPAMQFLKTVVRSA